MKIPLNHLTPETYREFSHTVYKAIEVYFRNELPTGYIPYALHPFAIYLLEFRKCAKRAVKGQNLLKELKKCAILCNERVENRFDTL